MIGLSHAQLKVVMSATADAPVGSAPSFSNVLPQCLRFADTDISTTPMSPTRWRERSRVCRTSPRRERE